MHYIVIGEEALTEDPEVVLIRQPVDNANLLICILKLSVNDHVLRREEQPVVFFVLFEFYVVVAVNEWVSVFTLRVRIAALNHEFDVAQSCSASYIEDAISFLVIDTGE